VSGTAIGLIIAGVGVGTAIISSVITWLLTVKNVETKLATKDEVKKRIKDCKDSQTQLCGSQFVKLNKELEGQGKTLDDHTRLLVKGDQEFTALRLAMSEIFDALKIPGGREKWRRIREDVLNGRSK